MPKTKPKTTVKEPTTSMPTWLSHPRDWLAYWRPGLMVVLVCALFGIGFTIYRANQSSVCPTAWFGRNNGPITHTTQTYSLTVPYEHWYEVTCQSDGAFVGDAQEFMAMNRQPKLNELVGYSASMNYLQPFFGYDPANVAGKTQTIWVRVSNSQGQTPEQLRDQINQAPVDEQLTESTVHRPNPAVVTTLAGHPAVAWESEATTYYDANYTKEYVVFAKDNVFYLTWHVQSKTELERDRYVQEFADEANAVISSFKTL